MATFAPISAQEAKLAGLLKPGPGEFEVVEAQDKVSQNNNTYLSLKLRVWDADGREQVVYDNVMYTGGMAWKLRHFAYACGQGEPYEAGSIDPYELVGLRGGLTIGSEVGLNGRNKTSVKDYLVPTEARQTAGYAAAKEQAMSRQAAARGPQMPLPEGQFKDADIPF